MDYDKCYKCKHSCEWWIYREDREKFSFYCRKKKEILLKNEICESYQEESN